MTEIEKLKWIYSQEVHAELTWVWDGGFDWGIGWPDGFEKGNCEDIEDAIEEMYQSAKKFLNKC